MLHVVVKENLGLSEREREKGNTNAKLSVANAQNEKYSAPNTWICRTMSLLIMIILLCHSRLYQTDSLTEYRNEMFLD